MNVLRRGAAHHERSLVELVNLLESLGDRSTVAGWSSADTARKVALERRIAEVVRAAEAWDDDGVRCLLEAVVRIGPVCVGAIVHGVVAGGILLELESRPRLAAELELRATTPWASGRRRSVRGRIVGIEGRQLRVALIARDPEEDRWTRRFVIDAVRSRVEWSATPSISTYG